MVPHRSYAGIAGSTPAPLASQPCQATFTREGRMTVPKALTAEEALIVREQQALNALSGSDHKYLAEPWSRKLEAIQDDVTYLENVVRWRAFALADEDFGGPYTYLSNKPTAFLSRKATRTSDPLTPVAGLYDRVALFDQVIKGRGKPAAIAKALDITRISDDSELLVVGSASPMSSRFNEVLSDETTTKAVTRNLVLVGPDGKAHITDPMKLRFHSGHSGMVLNNKGQFVRVFNSAEAKRWAYAARKHVQGMYIAQTPVGSEGVEMWDRAGDVLAHFRERLAKFPQGGIHSVVPVLLRCYGDGDHQRHILRFLPYQNVFGSAGLHHSDKLLHSTFCWRVHYTLDGNDLPGMAYCYEDGRFIISDWCFRETPDGKAEWEQFSGRDNKLDVLTWLVGPGADKFGGANHKFQAAFGRRKKEIFKGMWEEFVASMKAKPFNEEALDPVDIIKQVEKLKGKYVGLWDGSSLFIYFRSGMSVYKDTLDRPTHTMGKMYGYLQGPGFNVYNSTYYATGKQVVLPSALCEMLVANAGQANDDGEDEE